MQAVSCWEVPVGAAGLAVYGDVDLSRPTREAAEAAVAAARQVARPRTLSGLLLGSVGLHCASHATCPVVIVRGFGAGQH